MADTDTDKLKERYERLLKVYESLKDETDRLKKQVADIEAQINKSLDQQKMDKVLAYINK